MIYRNTAVRHNLYRFAIAFIAAATISMTACLLPAAAEDIKQKQFSSPEEAFRVLVEASRTNDTHELLAIFGPGGKAIISSGDAVADSNARARFVRSADESLNFKKLDKKTILAVTGKDACSFPIPIVKAGRHWVFSTEEGKQEIINRRIGRNELDTIRVSLGYIEAQREYASKDRDGSGVLKYAQRFMSHEGKKDGLYWKAAAGEESSPLGPLFARATEEGYTARKPGEKHKPYHGYFYRILKSQGRNAPGGELDYMIKDAMTGGFGLLAYPAEYGVSGIMTFIVNQQGIVYEKDLGPKTEEIAAAVTKFDPDTTWQKVKEAQ
ncbi:MAG: DUF2950 domain-containing protein [Nitrospirae bacterium]|nr:DUF2950 domain-containing protein [Nitrospirota bacterium]